MFKKIAVAFAAIVLLSGCSSCNKHGGKRVAEFEKVVGDKVFFKFNSSELTSDSKDTLKRQAKWLSEHTSYFATVEGHCDERGTREYNIALGERRANAVKKYLVKNGVKTETVDTISYGKEKPAVLGDTEEAYAKNRRGVTILK
jgi:peptidoglycan-associated lipoprotein